jgi:hypothetical protein
VVTDSDLAILNANKDKRVELTCTDGAIVIGNVIWVSPKDVLLDAVQKNEGTISSATVLAVSFDEIASVRLGLNHRSLCNLLPNNFRLLA